MYRKSILALAALLLAAPAAPAQEGRVVFPGPLGSGMLGFEYGVRTTPVSGTFRQEVVIRAVRPDSPAETAGLEVGDVVLRVNGLAATPDLLRSVGRTLEEGDTVRLDVRRADRRHSYTLVATARPEGSPAGFPGVFFDSDSIRRMVSTLLEEVRVRLDTLELPRVRINVDPDGFESLFLVRPDGERVVRRQPPDGVEIRHGVALPVHAVGRYSVAGAEFTELNPELRTYFQGATEGLLVLRVAPETPAARAGLKAGDVVTVVSGARLQSVSQLRSAVARPDGEPVRLQVLRHGEARELRLHRPAPAPPAAPQRPPPSPPPGAEPPGAPSRG